MVSEGAANDAFKHVFSRETLKPVADRAMLFASGGAASRLTLERYRASAHWIKTATYSHGSLKPNLQNTLK